MPHVFVGIQIPIVDVRPLCESAPRLNSPRWPHATPGSEFLRGVGRVRYRPKASPLPISGEGTFVNALGSLVRPKIFTSDADRIRFLYSRIFGTETGYRIDIGLRVPVGQRKDYLTVGRRALRQRVEVAGTAFDGPILASGNAFAEVLIKKSTPHDSTHYSESKEVEARDRLKFETRRLASAGTVLVMVENWDNQRITACASPHISGNVSAQIWKLDLDSRKKQESRALRAALWRLHYEAEILNGVLAFFKTDNSIPYNAERLHAYLERTTRVLVKSNRKGYQQHTLLAIASAVGGLDRTALVNFLAYIRDEAAATARRIDIILERTAMADNSIYERKLRIGKIVMGDNIKVSKSLNTNIVSKSNSVIEQSGLTSPQLLDELKQILGRDEVAAEPVAQQALEDLIEELKGPKRFDVAKKFWERLKSSSPVISTILASATLSMNLFG